MVYLKCKFNRLLISTIISQIIFSTNSIAEDDFKNTTFPINYCQNETKNDDQIAGLVKEFLPNYQLVSNKSKYIDCNPSNSELNLNIEKIYKNGAIKIDNLIYNLEQYCFQRSFSNSLKVQTCVPKCGGESPCIPKCCPAHQVYDYTLNGCSDENEESYWKPTFYKLHTHEDANCLERLSETEQISIKLQFRINEDILEDESLFKMYSRDIHNESSRALFKLLENGSLGIFQNEEHIWKLYDSFCIDGLKIFQENEVYSGLEDEIIILWNLNDTEEYEETNDMEEQLHEEAILCLESETDLIEFIYCVALYVSSVFLFLTVVVFLLNYEKLNLHMMVILSYIFTSFCALFFMATSKLPIVKNEAASTLVNAPGISCILIGIFAHFFLLSQFFWMTVINVDLWWTFRNSMPTNKKMNSRDFKIYFSYIGFAFGIPLINILVGISLDTHDKSINGEVEPGMCLFKNYINPQYGYGRCFISAQADGIYHYYWIGILLLINLLLFVSTLYILFACKIRKKMIERRLSKQKESFKIFAKLFIVMGVFWCSDFISWAARPNDEASCWIVVVFDMINFSQGFAIFLIFVCKLQTLRDLTKKYHCFKILFVEICSLKFGSENDYSHSGHGSTRGRNSRFSVQSDILPNSFKVKNNPSVTI